MNRAIQRRYAKGISGKRIHGVEWIEGTIYRTKWFKVWKDREDFVKSLTDRNTRGE